MRLLDRIFDWIRAASIHRWFWLGGPLLLYCWTVTGPFISDDLHLVLKSERYLRGETTDHELYRFAKSDEGWNELRNRGTCPWWLPERGRLDFFRPLSEISFLFDVWLFGRNVVGHRVVSLLFFSFALLYVHRLYRSASGDTIRAGAATFFFGISQAVTPPVTWLCNRNDLIVVIGASLAGSAYWSACRRPRALHIIVAITGFGAALCAKEIGVALGAVIIVHELITRRQRETRWDRPMAGLIAGLLLVMTVGYLVFYQRTRPWLFDSSGSDGVTNQMDWRWPLSLLQYSAVWTLGYPIDVLLVAPPWQSLVISVCGGLGAVIAIWYLLKSTRGEKAACFFALWAVFFILPGMRAVTASSRTLCTATIGWSYLVTSLIVPTREVDAVMPSILRHLYYAANGVVSIGCAIGTVLFMNHSELQAQAMVRKIVGACSQPLRDGHAIIAAQAGSPVENICGADRLEFMTRLRNVAFVHLLPPDIEATFEVQDDRTALLMARDRSLFGSPLHALTLPKNYRPQLGQRFRLRDFTVEIAEMRDDDFVAAMRLRFDEPLDSPCLHFYPPPLNALAKSGARYRAVDAKGS